MFELTNYLSHVFWAIQSNIPIQQFLFKQLAIVGCIVFFMELTPITSPLYGKDTAAVEFIYQFAQRFEYAFEIGLTKNVELRF